MATAEGKHPVARPGAGPFGRFAEALSFEGGVQRLLILGFLLFLVVFVLLPLGEVLRRAVHLDYPVVLFEPGDIRVAGHAVVREEGRYVVDGQPAPLVGGQATAPGVTVREAGKRITVTATTGTAAGREIPIAPIVVEFDGRSFLLDGRPLSEDQRQLTVSRYAGAANFRRFVSEPGLHASARHSLLVSLLTTTIAVPLAFLYAFGLTRTRMAGKPFFSLVAMLPLFAPTMLFGLSLVYLFGNKGAVTTGFFENFPRLAWDIGLYGPVGIVLAETVFAFPAVFMILVVALRSADARLYEAAASLGASPFRTFLTVTLPSARFGILSACFVAFTLAFTDFGAPKIVGGNYDVLPVAIYKHVVGQQNFAMGATVSLVLLLPTLAAFVADRLVQRRQVAVVSSRSVPYAPKQAPLLDTLFLAYCSAVACFLLTMVLTAGYASFVKLWPYDFSLGWWHYRFDDVGGGGYASLWNSLRVSLWSALGGTVLAFGGAYLTERLEPFRAVRQASLLLSILPLALPGLVIGIAYIFFFNPKVLALPFGLPSLPNPFQGLYGTIGILVASNVVHFFAVGFLLATTALRQLDREFEHVAASMAVPFWKTFGRVTVPVCLPTILEMAAFFFVNAMATVSAVIFLYTPDTRPAAVAVVNMDDAGDTAQAAAMSLLIVLAGVAVRLLFEGAGSLIGKRTSAWRRK